MRYLIALAEDDLIVPGALLADRELVREPAHVTIVGAKDDPAARALYAAARTYPTRYFRIEWLDRREGPAAGGRRRVSGAARGRRLRLRQRRLLGAGLHPRRGPSDRRQGRRPLSRVSISVSGRLAPLRGRGMGGASLTSSAIQI